MNAASNKKWRQECCCFGMFELLVSQRQRDVVGGKSVNVQTHCSSKPIPISGDLVIAQVRRVCKCAALS